jgi:hypothetical protein
MAEISKPVVNIAPSKVPDVEQLFTKLREPVETICNVWQSVKSAIMAMHMKAHIHLVRNYTVKEMTYAILMCVSASSAGDLESVGLKVTNLAPFIEVDSKKLKPQFAEVADAWVALQEAMS